MTPKKAPKISVVMGVYNGGSYLDEAISGIINQTFKDFEFIIIDDGSTDETAQLLKIWAERDSRLVILTNATNIGLSKTLNRGIIEARGEWIAREDADDRAMPERFARQMAFLANHPTVGLLGTGCWIIDQSGERQPPARSQPQTHREICWNSLWLNPFYHSSTLYKRELALQHPYDATLASAQDFELWGRLLKVTQGANLQEPLIEYRHHDERTSSSKFDQQQKIASSIVEKHLSQLMPEQPWTSAITSPLQNIVKNSWPNTVESAEDWLLLLRIFQAFENREGRDKTLHQKLLERLALSLTNSAGVKAERKLLTTFWKYAGLDFSNAISKSIYNRLGKRFS
jgi:glycosyltransferase involved in cell wall biosynthesis